MIIGAVNFDHFSIKWIKRFQLPIDYVFSSLLLLSKRGPSQDAFVTMLLWRCFWDNAFALVLFRDNAFATILFFWLWINNNPFLMMLLRRCFCDDAFATMLLRWYLLTMPFNNAFWWTLNADAFLMMAFWWSFCTNAFAAIPLRWCLSDDAVAMMPITYHHFCFSLFFSITSQSANIIGTWDTLNTYRKQCLYWRMKCTCHQ